MELKETSPDSFFLTRLDSAVSLGGQSRVGMRCCRMTTAPDMDNKCDVLSGDLSAQALIIDGLKICGGTFSDMNGESTARVVTSN